MKYLWSPWRMAYIQEHTNDEVCVFCRAAELLDGSENLIVARGNQAFVILNRYPYTSGHLMVVPFRHVSTVDQLNPEIRGEIFELTNRAIVVIQSEYRPQGFNIGMNIGVAAGAGITEHLHMHIVPRWGGDTNFMSSLAQTRVLPESLEETYARVQQAWRR